MDGGKDTNTDYMKKIITTILLLLPLFLMAQTAPPILQGSKYYEFKNGLRVDSAFFIPRKDTLFFDNTLKAPGMITWRPADSTLYLYRGDRWISILSSSNPGVVLDSARRSNDTLFFRYTNGGELAVQMNYYTKEESDSLISSNVSTRAILNQTSLQPNSNYNISGKGTNKTVLSAGVIYNNLIFNTLDTIYFFGTSITLGTGATAGQRYSTKTIAGTGGKERNYGIGSSTMEQGIPPRPLGARSMIDTLDGIPVKNARGRLLVIEYGLNDMGCNAPGYDTIFFKRDYRITLDSMRARGWNMKDILLFGPEYIPDSGYRKYATLNSGNGVPTLARHLQYVDAVRAIAAEYGTHWFNMYDSMRTHGGAALIGPDSLHPSNTGHNYMASVIIDYLKKNYGSDVNSSLFVDSTKVTTPKILVGGTQEDGTAHPLQVTGDVSLNGSKTIVGDLIGAFTGEIAVTRGGDMYTNASYGGFHIQPSGTGNASATVIGTVGRGTVRAGHLYFQKSNQMQGAVTAMIIDTSGNIGIGNFAGANIPRARLDISNGAIKLRQRIHGNILADSVMGISASDSTLVTFGINEFASSLPAPTLNNVTSVGDTTDNVIRITGANGTYANGNAIELYYSRSTNEGFINSTSRPSYTPKRLNIQYIPGTYAAPALTQIGGAGGDVTILGGNSMDSARTNVIVSGSISHPIVTTTGSITLNNTHYTVLCNNSAAMTVTLPTASSCPGRVYVIKKLSDFDSPTLDVTLRPITGNTIDGATDITITSLNIAVTVQSNGTNWFIIATMTASGF